MRLFRRLTAAALSLLLLCPLLPALAAGEEQETTILFTHDLHSHFLPQPDGEGGESGGFARLATALDRERQAHPDALTLDGGDFSIGSLFQTLYTTRAAELRTLGQLGYDATIAGNHEFDHTGTGFGEMLTAAKESGEDLPALLMANYKPTDPAVQAAMDAYGVRETMLLERGGVTYGLFGLMGVDSDDCAPTSGFTLEPMAQAAKRCVEELKAQGAQFIICLSHSGTDQDDPKASEDEVLAKGVEGIDLILSGHTHTTLTQPILVGHTHIVSAGPYCRNLGSITLTWTPDGKKTLKEYKLIPIDETLPEDPDIAARVEAWKELAGEDYLGRYGLTFDQVLTHADFTLSTPVSGVQEGNGLGALVSDAFLWATEELAGVKDGIPTVAVTADGVLRADLAKGDITTSMAFDVLSMGVGSDGTSGFPLVEVYLTGKELKAAAEVDASVTPIMNAAQLYMAGMTYSFNVNRMFFDRVTSAALLTDNGLEEIDDSALYRVVTGMYSAQMLGTVKAKSMGLLSLEPKLADGSPVTDFDACILRDEEGNEIKEWYALAAYLETFGAEGIDSRYTDPTALRKEVSHSLNPVELLKDPGPTTLAVLALVLLIVAAVVLLVRRLRRRKGSRPYRGRRQK